MENHHVQCVNPLFLWPCSIAMLNYQRVNSQPTSGSWFRSDHLGGLGVPPDSLDHRWVFVGENAEHHPGEVIIISKLDVTFWDDIIYIYIYDSSHLTILDSFGRYNLPFCIPFLAERDPLQHLRPNGGAPPGSPHPKDPQIDPYPIKHHFPAVSRFFMVFRCWFIPPWFENPDLHKSHPLIPATLIPSPWYPPMSPAEVSRHQRATFPKDPTHQGAEGHDIQHPTHSDLATPRFLRPQKGFFHQQTVGFHEQISRFIQQI